MRIAFIIAYVLTTLDRALGSSHEVHSDDCKKAPTYEGDTCQFFAGNWGLTVGELVNLNPEIKPDCSAFVPGTTYCVEGKTTKPSGVAPTSTKVVQSTIATSVGTPVAIPFAIPSALPKKPKYISTCNKVYTVKPGDSCWKISSDHFISVATFQSWNTNLRADCSIQPLEEVCVGIAGSQQPGPQPSLPGTAYPCKEYDIALAGKGIDVDWEYPRADDRGGRPEDFKNFPIFISNLKEALASAGKSGLSITLPASYWYLQHFDLKKLAPTVDFFNIMSYDMHGGWDKLNKWTGPYLNAHTNLTEIADALDLLWRNDVNPDQVVMGLGFYGRTFTTASSTCSTPGCKFTDVGKAGPCSNEPGILTIAEIIDTMKSRRITPQLYKKEAVKVLSWDDQWVSYDDEQTLQLKAEFARGQCLGGLMVWAISHDLDDGRFSLAVGNAAGRKSLSSFMRKSPYRFMEEIDVVQCRWTSCGEVCPHGFVSMPRRDKGARKGELMLDGSGCEGKGIATFCCPSNQELPICSWEGFRNGKCKPGCLNNQVEVGRNAQNCNNGKYQSACCTDSKSVAVYGTCKLNDIDICELTEKCSNKPFDHQFGWYNDGGRAQCNLNVNSGISWRNSLSLCCDTSQYGKKIDNCEWFDNIGHDLPGARKKNACKTGCPSDRIRMSLDAGRSGRCHTDGGARANCCKVDVTEKRVVEDKTMSELDTALKEFMSDPICPDPQILHNPFAPNATAALTGEQLAGTIYGLVGGGLTFSSGPSDPRSRYNANFSSASSDVDTVTLSKRQRVDSQHLRFLVGWLGNLIRHLRQEAVLAHDLDRQGHIWDDQVRLHNPELQVVHLRENIADWGLARLDEMEAAHELLCHMNQMNEMFVMMKDERTDIARAEERKKKHLPLDCAWDLCNREGCVVDPPSGEIFDPDGDPDILRRSDTVFNDLEASTVPYNTSAISVGKPTPYDVMCTARNGGAIKLQIKSRPYPQAADKLFKDREPWIFNNAYDYQHILDCNNLNIKRTPTVDGKEYDIEHIIERNSIPRFFNDVSAGRLAGEKKLDINSLSCEFISQALNQLYLPRNSPPLPSSPNSRIPKLWRPADRLFDALGSTTNRVNLMFLRGSLNELKSRVFTVFAYLNDPIVQRKMMNVCNAVRDQMMIIETEWNRQNPFDIIQLQVLWDRWIRSAFSAATEKGKTFVQVSCIDMMTTLTGYGVLTQQQINIQETVRAYIIESYWLKINLDGLA